MQKKWVIKSAAAIDLSLQLGVCSITSRILFGRGIDTIEAGLQFLVPALSTMPDPFLLKGMQAAVVRVIQAQKLGEKVCIYGDYDVDGITGTALLVSFLRQVGLTCTYFIPNRFDDGMVLTRKLYSGS